MQKGWYKAMNMELKKQLTVLEPGDLVSVIENQEKNVSPADLNYNDRLEHLPAELITERQNRLIARLTKNVELKCPNASLGTLDCEAGGISRDMIVNPASMGFVSADANLSIREVQEKRTCHVCLGQKRVNRLCGPAISECLICRVIFKTIRISSGSRSGIGKGLGITRF